MKTTPGNKWLDAGSVAPSACRYVVTWPHGHKHLNPGDIVVMVEAPNSENHLLRLSDMTLHSLQGQSEQYVHLVASKPEQVKKSARK